MRVNVFLKAFFVAAILITTSCGKKSTDSGNATAKPVESGSVRGIDRLRWNMETLVGAYLNTGERDERWNEPATNLLARFALIRSSKEDIDDTQLILLRADAREAVGNGCKDPLVLYLYARYAAPELPGATEESIADAFRKAAEAMKDTRYPPIRHFYIYLRAAENLWTARKGNDAWPEVSVYRQMAGGYLTGALKDPDIPQEEVLEACRDFSTVVKDNPVQFNRMWQPIEAELVQHWPDQAFVHLLQGTARITAAWNARGGGYANKVTQEGWTGFATNLALATKSLETAWKLDPNNAEIAAEMMRVELGEGKGIERLNLWFNRAMNVSSNYYRACETKLLYLDPKWYGSPQAMLEFGRECVASEKWGGNVPLILMDAHRSLSRYAADEGMTNYWRQPSVWRDIKSSFDRFFALNPNAVGWHHDYAWYAYEAGEWDAFNKRLPLLGPINYSFFGGQTNFEQMVKFAREQADKSSVR